MESDPLDDKIGGDRMKALLTRMKSSPSLRRKLEPGSRGTSLPRKVKSAQSKQRGYPPVLEGRSGFMKEDSECPSADSRKLWQTLLGTDRACLEDLPFHNNRFKAVYQDLQDRNKATFINDIARLIVQYAQQAALYGAKDLQPLT